MMRYPRLFYEAFQNLFKLDETKCKIFIDELKKSKPSESFSTLSEKLVNKINLSSNEIKEILIIFTDLYKIQKDLDITIKDFLDDIKDGFISIKEESFVPEEYNWDIFDYLWKNILSDDFFIGMKAKAKELITTHEKVYHNGRMITDFRPIYYKDEVDKEPEYGVIIHTFKIEYMENYERKKIHISLDPQDLEDLQLMVDRELRKGSSFTNLLKDRKVSIIKIE